MPTNQPIYAHYNDKTIRVYQAFANPIADSALANQRFVEPAFKMTRMSWIKPSFLWMMYRCGWASKAGQERVLAIDIRREGFDWAVRHACLSRAQGEAQAAWQEKIAKSDVIVQWDPERDIHSQAIENRRAIQIGLRDAALLSYVNDWTVEIADITVDVLAMQQLLATGQEEALYARLPIERLYPLATDGGLSD